MTDKTAYIDFDGTVVNVFPRYFKILNEYLNHDYDGQLVFENFVRQKRDGIKEHEIVKKTLGIDIDIEKYVNFKRARLEDKEYLKEDLIIGNPHKAYAKLKGLGYQVNLLSQRRKPDNLLWEISYLNLKDCFDNISTVFPTSNNAKLEYLKDIAKKEDIIIGDSPLDMECATELGIRGWFVESGLLKKERLAAKVQVAENYNMAVQGLSMNA